MVSTLLSLGFFSPIKQSNPLIKSNQTVYIKEFNLKMNQTFLEDKTCKSCQTLAESSSGWAKVGVTVGGGPYGGDGGQIFLSIDLSFLFLFFRNL